MAQARRTQEFRDRRIVAIHPGPLARSESGERRCRDCLSEKSFPFWSAHILAEDPVLLSRPAPGRYSRQEKPRSGDGTGTVCNPRRFAEAGIPEDRRGHEYLRSHKSGARQVTSPRLVRFAMTVDSTTLHSALVWSDVSDDGAGFKYRILSDNNSREVS